MKTAQRIIKAALVLFMGVACNLQQVHAQDSKKEKESAKAEAVKKITTAKTFVFHAESLTPMKGGVRHLSPGYTLKVSGDTVIADLPYFGRVYQPSLSSDGGIKFTSTKFEYSSTDRKKGGWDIVIKPKDASNVQEVSLTVFEDGSSSLRISCSDRQPITYNGFIE